MYSEQINRLKEDRDAARALRDFRLSNDIDLEIEELKIRQHLRQTLFKALEFLADKPDAGQITALIKQTIKDTAP